MRRFAFPAIILGIIVVLGAVAVFGFGSDAPWGDRWDDDGQRVETVQVMNPDGSTTPARAIVDDHYDGPRGGFFPFGLLFFPLMILLVIGLVRAVFGRGPGGPGGRYGPDGAWLEDWHRRQHQENGTPAA